MEMLCWWQSEDENHGRRRGPAFACLKELEQQVSCELNRSFGVLCGSFPPLEFT